MEDRDRQERWDTVLDAKPRGTKSMALQIRNTGNRALHPIMISFMLIFGALAFLVMDQAERDTVHLTTTSIIISSS